MKGRKLADIILDLKYALTRIPDELPVGEEISFLIEDLEDWQP